MAPTPAFAGIVDTNGKLEIARQDLYDAHLRTVIGEVQIIVRKRRKPRSTNQNNYYWGVVVKMIADEIGDSPLETEEDVRKRVHEGLRMEFLPLSDLPLRMSRSTTTLSTAEMEDYLSKVRMWAASRLNIIIPLPNECEIPEYV